MESLKILLTYQCNLKCDYCFVIHNQEMMTAVTLEKILVFGIKHRVKKIVLTGGEPTINWELIIRAAQYMKKNADYEYQFDCIPTNGTLLDQERIILARTFGLKFAFSMDGFSFAHNKHRNKNQKLYDKIMQNLEIYKSVYGCPPLIKFTVLRDMAHIFHKNVFSLVQKGFVRIQITPEFGEPWNNEQTKSFLSSLDKLMIIHKEMKGKIKNLSIDPIDWYSRMIPAKDYHGITQNQCDMGSKVAFNPVGKAYACLSMHNLKDNHPLKHEYCIGDIHTNVDLDKMRTFKDYLICSEFPVNAKYNFPNISCRKVCATVNFKTGDRLQVKEIENLMEIEYKMFQRTYEAYFKQ